MHYIRCLRPPKLAATAKSARVELLFTVTTDLGDSFLSPETPIKLFVTVHDYSLPDVPGWRLPGEGQILWKPGQRVAKPVLQLPPPAAKALAVGNELQLCISSASNTSATSTDDIISRSATDSEEDGGLGLILPVWIALNPTSGDDGQISTRKLQISGANPPVTIEAAEEIGESIARHIWDAGLVALCAFAEAARHAEPDTRSGPCMQSMREMLIAETKFNILELGCGVGILGVGIAAAYSSMHPTAGSQCTILMTDVEEAGNQARANISRQTSRHTQPESVEMLYENLDWEDGRRRAFGPLAGSRHWDLIVLSDCTYNVDMLPALVETLSALHDANMQHQASGAGHDTKVFLATKPRHPSERALFDLMSQHGWDRLQEQVIPLPMLGSEPESVEFYLFGKK